MRIALLLALLVAAPLAAQDPRLDARLPPDARAGVAEAISDARGRDLPVEPLVQKALEGAAAGADPALIVEAVRELAGRMAAARDALGPEADADELTSAAGALRLGASAADLRGLRSRAGAPITLPLVVLADLVQRGVPAAAALEAIQALVEARLPAAAYTELRESVARDIRAGAAPAAAARTRARGVLLDHTPARPAPTTRPTPARPRPPVRRPGGPIR